MTRLSRSPSPLPLLLITCRRAAAVTLYELADKLSAPEQRNRCAWFVEVHHDDIVRMPESALRSIALTHGGRVALIPKPGTGIVELMSEDTYMARCQPDRDNRPQRRPPRPHPIWNAFAEGFAALAGWSGSSSPKP